MASKRPIAFDACHATVPAALFAGAVALSMLAVHPVCVAVSLAGALLFSLLARGGAATVRGLAWQLPLLDELGDQMRRHPEQEWNFAAAATRLHVGLTHFRRLFRQYFGSSPQQFLIRLRLEQAARMLIASRETLAAIAETVGIGDEYYFSHLFKQRYGVSPGAYRREFHRSE